MICGQCNQASDCTLLPPDDECQTRVCTGNTCSQTFTAAGTVLSMQTAGDCREQQCDGARKTIDQPNDADLPEDNNLCTKNLCMAGTPSFPFEPENTDCGMNSVCNAAGQCVGCLMASDCAGMDDFCKTRTCNDNVCGFSFTAPGTDLPNGQMAGDCKILECDAQGSIATNPNTTDLPNDGNPCTKDLCTAGVASNPPEPAGTPCTDGGTCNGAGTCLKPNGRSCAAAGECVSGICADGICCNMACGQTCKSCNVPGSVGVCSTVPAGFTDDSFTAPQSCDGSIGGNSCINKLPNGSSCASNLACGSNVCVDGVCCNTTCNQTCRACNVFGNVGTCSNIPTGVEDAPLCIGTNSCDGAGACKKIWGRPAPPWRIA